MGTWNIPEWRGHALLPRVLASSSDSLENPSSLCDPSTRKCPATRRQDQPVLELTPLFIRLFYHLLPGFSQIQSHFSQSWVAPSLCSPKLPNSPDPQPSGILPCSALSQREADREAEAREHRAGPRPGSRGGPLGFLFCPQQGGRTRPGLRVPSLGAGWLRPRRRELPIWSLRASSLRARFGTAAPPKEHQGAGGLCSPGVLPGQTPLRPNTLWGSLRRVPSSSTNTTGSCTPCFH